ncbi:SLC13 family permease [Enteractinococcus coprophilus]|uniref:Sodium-dependent dicarboxylate transporter SdcS n=1 Tax=Enteractinococcus coprophilus TaxID=1027633 RepID=A0A543AK81_9MICC|nr:DASS family sodium-coupled anion symporter [Enteractinococcus coprophilus]TQL72921.1 anion transporter [Enteractinococcus coprophilus]
MATSDSHIPNEQTERAKLDRTKQVHDGNKKHGQLRDGQEPSWLDRYLPFIWIGFAFAAMFTIMFLPPFEGLSTAGQRSLAILVFAVIMWITEAVSYPISSVMILVIIALSIGFSPDPDSPGEILGTTGGLSAALSGFATSAVALVAAALALAAAMQATGLHRRLAFHILRFSGEKVSNILIGAIVIATLLAFFVPSATARAGAVVPILLGMIIAFGMPLNSKLGALLIITAAQAISIWNIGIKTAAAQNLVADGFILEIFGESISWPRWFMIGAPWSILMSIVLYFVMRWAIKPETRVLQGGKEVVREGLAKLGPISAKEIRLAVLAGLMLVLWSTEGTLHELDSSTITLTGIALMLIPKVGVLNWDQLESMVNWGTLVVFAIGISLGSLLLNSGAAEWLSAITFEAMGLSTMPLLATIAIVSVFNILIHLGFASATALSSALIPVFIVLAMSIPGLPEQGVGFVIIQQFVISFGFILPISAPQNMLAYGTGTFTVKQFMRAGIPLTVVGYLLVLLLSATYWQWIGVL